MAITSGFFNSLSGDRTYNASQMSEYFEGMVSDGVFANVGNALQVKAATGMEVNVQSGRAFIDSRWMKNDAVHSITLNSAHVTLPRYTAIMVRLDETARTIEIVAVDGTPASSPLKPAVTRSSTIKELCLAYVYVPAGATTISQANITDMRASESCGWVTGVIKQVDTSELFLQYQTAYETFYEQMQSWQEQQKAQFEAWFDTLTGQLQVNTHLEKYHKVIDIGTENGVFPLDMVGYVYEETDIFMINVNGIMLTEVYDYLLDTSKTPVEIHTNATLEADNLLEITVLKSKIG